jgi:hypothetical protein
MLRIGSFKEFIYCPRRTRLDKSSLPLRTRRIISAPQPVAFILSTPLDEALLLVAAIVEPTVH